MASRAHITELNKQGEIKDKELECWKQIIPSQAGLTPSTSGLPKGMKRHSFQQMGSIKKTTYLTQSYLNM
jgi:hypothetical protein